MTRRDGRRHFSKSQQKEILHQQGYRCAECGADLDLRATHFDHITPWAQKGPTVVSNGQALCSNCHSIKNHHENMEQIEPEEDEPSRNSGPFNIFGPSPFDPQPEKRSGKKANRSPSLFEPLSFEPPSFEPPRNPFEPEPKKKGKGRNRRPSSMFDFRF